MKQYVLTTTTVLALALAGPVWAQSTTTEETTETTETTETAEQTTEETTDSSSVDQEFPVAGEDDGEGEIGQGYLKTKHGEYEVRCIKAEEGQKENCQVYHLLPDSDGNSIAEFTMTALPKGNKAVAGVDVATPLGTLLTAQVQFKIDGGKTVRYPFTWCDQLACYARFGLTLEQINSMKRGANALFTVRSIAATNTPIEINMSLSGFTAAWNEIAPE